MIITRTPLRICLAGGGTDLPEYSNNNGGYVISATIDKFIFIVINKFFGNNYIIKYSSAEIVESVHQIKHPIFKEVLKLLNIEPGVEIVSFMDLPAKTGLGSSSSFTVGLLKAIYSQNNENIKTYELAKKAVFIERTLLKEAGGIQDQYIASYGGIRELKISRNGKVNVRSLPIKSDIKNSLNKRLLMFYTGIQRRSSDVQARVSESIISGNETKNYLDRTKEIGIEASSSLQSGNLDYFGQLMDQHWNEKKSMAKYISSNIIDDLYTLGKKKGAVGGKIIGAGGGGFLLFYVPKRYKNKLRMEMSSQGLEELSFNFEKSGSRVSGAFEWG